MSAGGRPSLGKRISTAIRFPVEMHARLDTAATERDVSINYLVVRAVERYLDAMPPLPEAAESGRSDG